MESIRVNSIIRITEAIIKLSHRLRIWEFWKARITCLLQALGEL